jgi:hypothetical protein
MSNGLILLVLAVLLMGACLDPNSAEYRRRTSMIDLANTCATCGASVSGDYFAGSNFRAIGPGNY